jgi:hypothetical protein
MCVSLGASAKGTSLAIKLYSDDPDGSVIFHRAVLLLRNVLLATAKKVANRRSHHPETSHGQPLNPQTGVPFGYLDHAGNWFILCRTTPLREEEVRGEESPAKLARV